MFENYKWHSKLPAESLEVSEENLSMFFEVMFERQNIWKKRFVDRLSAPWTKNSILAESKFTNVYRELDNHSQWQIKNIILDKSLSLRNLIWKIMVFRYFNNPSTFSFAETTRGWNAGIPDWENYKEEDFVELLKDIRDCGANPFTNAYLINSMAAPGKSRDYCYSRVVIPFLHKNINELIKKVLTAKNPEEIIEFLKTFPGVADFIAHEFYQDFTYISRYTNRKFMKFTQDDYTNVGPGASVGIRLIFPDLKGQKQKEGIYRLRDLAKTELAKFGKMPFLYWDKDNNKYYCSNECNITLHQIEMWLCEFQKYWKMTIGEGKQRSKFVPKSKTIIGSK